MSNIIKGIINYVNDNNIHLYRDITHEQRSSERVRAGICGECEFKDTSILFMKFPETKYPKIRGRKCKQCGCILSLKIRSKSSCPINRWKNE